MKKLTTYAPLALALLALPSMAEARTPAAKAAEADIQKTFGFVPGFMKQMPDSALPGLWEAFKGYQMNPKTALPPKVKELIGLGVAAQIPCAYCTYAHTEFAKLNGASQQEIGEAVAIAGLARQWSTVFNGNQLDLNAFRADVGKWVAYAKKGGPGENAKPIQVTDAASAKREIAQSLGSVPAFIEKVPPELLPGAWKNLRDVEMSPATALSGKYKSLISLGVASQIPCAYCVAADTEFAKLEGATDREIQEAVAMAALVRNLSTMLNGLQMDQGAFRRDVNRLVRGAKKAHAVASRK